MIINSPAGNVKNRVISAYLQAFYDLLDYDGMKSILNEAGLLELKDQRDPDPNESIALETLNKIIAAQNCLLYGCDDLLYEIGKKFSFYLFPYGKSLAEILDELKELIQTNWHVKLVKETENEVLIHIQNCIFCSDPEKKADLLIGFLIDSLEKSLPRKKKVFYKGKEINSNNSFLLKFKIEDIN
ncbi:MAG: hypothetical protein ACTSR8_09585 [Promethearchaeota archaeon]